MLGASSTARHQSTYLGTQVLLVLSNKVFIDGLIHLTEPNTTRVDAEFSNSSKYSDLFTAGH